MTPYTLECFKKKCGITGRGRFLGAILCHKQKLFLLFSHWTVLGLQNAFLITLVATNCCLSLLCHHSLYPQIVNLLNATQLSVSAMKVKKRKCPCPCKQNLELQTSFIAFDLLKNFKKVVCIRLINFLDKRNIFLESQHSFNKVDDSLVQNWLIFWRLCIKH